MTSNPIIIYFIILSIIASIFLIAIILNIFLNLSSKTTRKIIHVLTAPVFILLWKLYPKGNFGNICSTIPLGAASVLLFLYIFKNYNITKTMKNVLSRSGDLKEIVEGPFFYAILVGILTSIFYLNHPIGIITIIILSFGDGFADVVGSNFESLEIPSPFGKKTLYGSIAFLLFSIFFSVLYSYLFFYKLFFFNCVILSILGCIFEILSPSKYDNIFIVIGVAFFGYKFLNWS